MRLLNSGRGPLKVHHWAYPTLSQLDVVIGKENVKLYMSEHLPIHVIFVGVMSNN